MSKRHNILSARTTVAPLLKVQEKLRACDNSKYFF